MNERLSTNVEVDGSRVGVDLVHKVVAVVDQVFLQVSKPETLRLGKRKGSGFTCSTRSQPRARCSLGWWCRHPED